MSLNLGTMFAAVALDSSNFRNGLSALPGEAEQSFSQIKDIATRYLTLDAIRKFTTDSINAFITQENSIQQYRSSLRNLGVEYTHGTQAALAFAGSLQQITKYGDEVTMSAMAQGIKLGIDPEQIQDATRAAMVLAEKYGIELPSAMMLLGRASQGQTSMLTRYGIVLDENMSAQEKFNHLLNLGKEEFNLVTDAVNTTQGTLTQMQNALGDSMELFGERAAERLIPFAEMVTDISTAFNSLTPSTQGVIMNIGEMLLVMGLMQTQTAQNLNAQVRSIGKATKEMFGFYNTNAKAAEAAEARKTAAQDARVAKLEINVAREKLKLAELAEAEAHAAVKTARHEYMRNQSAISYNNMVQKELAYKEAIKQTTIARAGSVQAEVAAAQAKRASAAASMTAAQAEKAASVGSNIMQRAIMGVGAGFRAAGHSVKAFFASLGPIGWIVLAFQAVTAAISYFSDKAEEARKNATEAAEAAYNMAQKESQTAQEQQKEIEEKTLKLEELAKKERLSVEEQESAIKMMKDLNKEYDIQIGKINAHTGALELNTKEAENARKQAKINAKDKAQKELEALHNNIKRQRLNVIEVVDDEGHGGFNDKGLATGAISGEVGGEGISIESLSEAVRNKYWSSAERQEMQKLLDLAIKKQELQQKFADLYAAVNNFDADERARKKAHNDREKEKRDKDADAAKKAYYDAKKKDDYDNMSDAEKLIFQRKEKEKILQDIAFADRQDNKDKQYYENKKKLLDILKEEKRLKEAIARTEESDQKKAEDDARKKAEDFKKAAEEGKRITQEFTSLTEAFLGIDEKKAEQDRDRAEKENFDALLAEDAVSAQSKASGMKQELARLLAVQLEQFKKFDQLARLDNRISEDERAEYQRYAAERNRLMDEQKKWEAREADAAGKLDKDTAARAGSISAWSAAVLDLMIGQGQDYEKQTAKNTKKSTDLLQKIVEQSDTVDATYG